MRLLFIISHRIDLLLLLPPDCRAGYVRPVLNFHTYIHPLFIYTTLAGRTIYLVRDVCNTIRVKTLLVYNNISVAAAAQSLEVSFYSTSLLRRKYFSRYTYMSTNIYE